MVQYQYIFENYIVVGSFMQKIMIVALSVQKLGWGVLLTRPPHPFSVHNKAHPE